MEAITEDISRILVSSRTSRSFANVTSVKPRMNIKRRISGVDNPGHSFSQSSSCVENSAKGLNS
jgi:hypothetical protein